MGSCRCKMCGGHIHYDNDASVATCEFCGTEQTIVKTDDLKKLNLFNRANALRMQNEFDKAQLTYDNILIDDPNNAEAHWGICLCRYGIEYIDASNKRVPTCHRTAIKSIFDDLDYKETIENADVVAKVVYEKEAKEIDRIQKEILSISQKEKPYDIFISYKEKDLDNNRTKDSIIAEDIYNALTNKGYRVFYSKKVLENKEPSQFEPVIFAALMSAKVMLPIGSSTENFNSTWEKNEWSRFLKFMEEKGDKYLIPCYFDMEAYDMPDEFLSFENVNLDDEHYMDILYHRLDKLFDKNKDVEIAKASANRVNSSRLDNLIERAKFCLNEKDFTKVDEIIENILNIDYRCAEAYYLKIFVNKKVCSIDEMIKEKMVLDDDKNYETAIMFANEKFGERLATLNQNIKDSIKKEQLDAVYAKFLSSASSRNFEKAFKIGFKIKDYRDVKNRLEALKEDCYHQASIEQTMENYNKAMELYGFIKDYKDSKEQFSKCRMDEAKRKRLIEARNFAAYMDAIIDNYKNKTVYANDLAYYQSYYTQLKCRVHEDPTWMQTLEYYESFLNLISKVSLKKTVEARRYRKQERQYIRGYILKMLMILGVIVYLCILIIPLVVFIRRGDEKMAGLWCGVDTILLVAAVLGGVIVGDNL